MTEKAQTAKQLKKKKIKKAVPKHVVVYQDEEGNVLKTTFVPHGKAASPPEPPAPGKEEEHYKLLFDGWDQDASEVTSNLVLKPLWRKEPRKYLVMYFHENGSMLGMESVAYGSPALMPYTPKKDSDDEYDYPFIGWNCDLSRVEGDTNAKAVFGKVKKVFTVRFYHEDGTLLKEEKVHFNESAHPPGNVIKEPDPVYHYQFGGWTYPTDHIKESLNIHAIFKYIYNEYTVTFYEEEKLHSTQTLHYEEEIIYPELYRKGYDLIWDKHIEKVTGDVAIYARWNFSNPVNKIVTTPRGVFRITNPSIHRGTVCCLNYFSNGEKHVKLPSEVRAGEYYYRISEIGPYAFCQCANMEVLTLPDTIKRIEDRGLASCSQLRMIRIRPGIRSVGRGIFADDLKLKDVIVEGRGKGIKLNKELIGKAALERAPKRLKFAVHSRFYK